MSPVCAIFPRLLEDLGRGLGGRCCRRVSLSTSLGASHSFWRKGWEEIHTPGHLLHSLRWSTLSLLPQMVADENSCEWHFLFPAPTPLEDLYLLESQRDILHFLVHQPTLPVAAGFEPTPTQEPGTSSGSASWPTRVQGLDPSPATPQDASAELTELR